MTNKKLLLVLPVVAVIIASGCTNVGTGAGSGVVILDFLSDGYSPRSGETVQLQLRLQNQGEIDAYNVRAELTGIDVSEWGSLLGTAFTAEDYGRLAAYNRRDNVPGGMKVKTWRLQAPDQPKGITNTYTPIAKVSYDYKTTAQRMITMVNEEELRRILQNGGTLPGNPVAQSSGPLSVEIITGNYERVSSSGFYLDNVFPVSIRIRNAGGGVVVPPGTGTGLYGGGFSSSLFGEAVNYPIGVRITPPSGTSLVSSGGGFLDDCTTGTVAKELWMGDEATITCELTINTPPVYREDRPLTVEVFYRYQIGAQTSIQVSGRDSGFGSSPGGFGGYY